MPCDDLTYRTAHVDLAPRSTSAFELGNSTQTRETDVQRDKSPKQFPSASTADQFKSQGHRHDARSRVMPDSTQTDPEYVWGDEGPVRA